MINFSDKDKKFIQENFESIEAKKLLNAENVNDVLEALFDLMAYKGFDSNDDLNDFGREAEDVYYKIYYNN